MALNASTIGGSSSPSAGSTRLWAPVVRPLRPASARPLEHHDRTTYFTRTPSGQLVSMRTPGGTDYYLLDGLGSVVGLVDASGNVVARYQCGPYGSVTSSGPEADANPWQYASSFLDGAFGLEKVGSRYYDAALARFTQVSPFMLDNIMLTSGSDECVYVHDDPVNLVDVTGLCGTTALTAEAVWTAFDTGFWLALVLSPETGGLSLFAYLALAGLPAVNWAGLGVEVSSCFG